MSGLSVPEAVHHYLAALVAEGAPAGTYKQYRSVLLRLCKAFPHRQHKGLTTKDLSDFLYGEAGILVGKSSATGTSYRAALNGFFAYGCLRGWSRYAAVVPKPVIRPRGGVRARQRASRPTRLTRDELALMLRHASEMPKEIDARILRGIVAIGISTALRISDILKIRLEDIDLEHGILCIWSQKTQKFDEKPITLDLDEELRSYLAWYAQALGVTDSSQYLFPGWQKRKTGRLWEPDTSRPCNYRWALDRLHPLFQRSGIQVEDGEAWHVIRRSVARIYFDDLRKEISHDHALRQTAALLDHDLVETTEKYLGTQAEVEARNESLRGRRFISSVPDSTVIPLRRTAER